jgi:(p)ppGpp synthase/HD superfamily hydrolase
MNIKEKALKFATKAHQLVGQKRKYSGEDYIVHPIEVAGLVADNNGTDEMIAAAYLHDVVEDTGVSLEEIRAEFGDTVARLVDDLTNVSKPSDGNRRTRKALDLKHTAQSSEEAKIIKLADLISNTKSIVQNDPSFARVYLSEKRDLLKVLKSGHKLYSVAQSLLEESWNKLNKN